MPKITYKAAGGVVVTGQAIRPSYAVCINYHKSRMSIDQSKLSMSREGIAPEDTMRIVAIEALQAVAGLCITPFQSGTVPTGTPSITIEANNGQNNMRYLSDKSGKTSAMIRFAVEKLVDSTLDGFIAPPNVPPPPPPPKPARVPSFVEVLGDGDDPMEEDDDEEWEEVDDNEWSARSLKKAIEEGVYNLDNIQVGVRLWIFVQDIECHLMKGVVSQIRENLAMRNKALHSSSQKKRKEASEDSQLKKYAINSCLSVHGNEDLANAYSTYSFSGFDFLAGATPPKKAKPGEVAEKEGFQRDRVGQLLASPDNLDGQILSPRSILNPQNNPLALTEGVYSPTTGSGDPLWDQQNEHALYFPCMSNSEYTDSNYRLIGSASNNNLNYDKSQNVFVVPVHVERLGLFKFLDPSVTDPRFIPLPDAMEADLSPPTLVKIFLEENCIAEPRFAASDFHPESPLARRCFRSFMRGNSWRPSANSCADDVVQYRRATRHAAEHYSRSSDEKNTEDPQKRLYAQHARVHEMIEVWNSRQAAEGQADPRAAIRLTKCYADAMSEYHDLVITQVETMLQCERENLGHGVQVRLAAGEALIETLPNRSAVLNRMKKGSMNGPISKDKSPFGVMCGLHTSWANYVMRLDNEMPHWFAAYIKALAPTLVNIPKATQHAKWQLVFLGNASAGKSYFMDVLAQTLPPGVAYRAGTHTATALRNGYTTQNCHPCFYEEANQEVMKPGTQAREEWKAVTSEGVLTHCRTQSKVGPDGDREFVSESIVTVHEDTAISASNDGPLGGALDFPGKAAIQGPMVERMEQHHFRERDAKHQAQPVNSKELMKTVAARKGKLTIDVMDYLTTLLMTISNCAPGIEPDLQYAECLVNDLNKAYEQKFQPGARFNSRQTKGWMMKVRVLSFMHAVFVPFVCTSWDLFFTKLRPRGPRGNSADDPGYEPLLSPEFNIRQLKMCFPVLRCPTPEIVCFAWQLTCYETLHLSPMHTNIVLASAHHYGFQLDGMLKRPNGPLVGTADEVDGRVRTMSKPASKAPKVDNSRLRDGQQSAESGWDEDWENHLADSVACGQRLRVCRNATYRHAASSKTSQVDMDEMRPTIPEVMSVYSDREISPEGRLGKKILREAGRSDTIEPLEEQRVCSSRLVDPGRCTSFLPVTKENKDTHVKQVSSTWVTTKNCHSAKGMASILGQKAGLAGKGMSPIVVRELLMFSELSIKPPSRKGENSYYKSDGVDDESTAGLPPVDGSMATNLDPHRGEDVLAGWKCLAQRVIDSATRRGALRSATSHMNTGAQERLPIFTKRPDPDGEIDFYCANVEAMRRAVALLCEARCGMRNVSGAGCEREPESGRDHAQTYDGLPSGNNISLVYSTMSIIQAVLQLPNEGSHCNLFVTPFETYQDKTNLFQIPRHDLIDPSKLPEAVDFEADLPVITPDTTNISILTGASASVRSMEEHTDIISRTAARVSQDRNAWHMAMASVLERSGLSGPTMVMRRGDAEQGKSVLLLSDLYSGVLTRKILPAQMPLLYTDDPSLVRTNPDDYDTGESQGSTAATNRRASDVVSKRRRTADLMNNMTTTSVPADFAHSFFAE